MEPSKSFESPEAKLHFLDYWRIIRIRKTVILAVFLLVAITTTLVTYILPPTYSSTVRISVEKDASDTAGLDGQKSLMSFDPFWLQTQNEKIQSKLILHQVITNLDLTRKWAEKYKESELRLDIAYNMLKRQTTVNQSRNTSFLEITAFSDDFNEAALIANKIAEVYRDSRLTKWREMSGRGLQALMEEYEANNTTLTNLQVRLDALKAELGITDMESQNNAQTRTLEPETLLKLEGERIQTSADYARLKSTYEALINLSPIEQRKAMSTASPDMQLSQLQETLASREQALAGLTNSYSLNHPDVKGLRDVIAVLNQQIDIRLDGILRGLKVNLDGREAHLKTLTAEVAAAKNKDMDEAQKRRPYQNLKRELDSIQYVRERLNVRIWQEKVEIAMPRQGIVEIIDKAEPNLRPVKPNKILNITIGVIIGLGIGIGLAFFIEYLDTSVKTIDDVERALQAPVLGVIPQNVSYLIFEGPDSPHAEAYRVLRTNIMFSLKDPKLNTITVVSAGAGEGKSTTIFNLATVFAQNGARVLVVDSDLRRPSLHKVLKVPNSIGLTNFLLKQNTLEEVIQTTPLSTLDFLPSGKLPSSSMGVLSSSQMKELIRDLKRRYDYVFFDSPPIMGVSDASILSSEVDCVMQVIQYRRYPQPMTIRAKQMIEKVGGNLLGIVLNNINMASDENYYYYSGYYYDYSKNEESEPDKPEAAGKTDDKAGAEIKPKY